MRTPDEADDLARTMPFDDLLALALQEDELDAMEATS